MVAPGFRKNECCVSSSEGAKCFCVRKKDLTPNICKASGERKKTWWTQELWDCRAVCLPAGSLTGEPVVWSAQGNLESPV